MILIVLAHPYPDRSHANRILAVALDGLHGVTIRSLYDLYPDFAIDADAERRALSEASAVVLQHPVLWYSPPALLKLWFEKVLTHGWAWGRGGTALQGKRCLWVVTTGGDEQDYGPTGIHRHDFAEYSTTVRQIVEFCGMTWVEPIVVHEARRLGTAELEVWGARYRECVAELAAEVPERGVQEDDADG